MRKLWLTLFILLISPAFAQDSATRVVTRWVSQPQQPPSNNIMFIIDGSGSMNEQKASIAINYALQIAGAPVDDLQIAIVTFGNEYSRWEGAQDIKKLANL